MSLIDNVGLPLRESLPMVVRPLKQEDKLVAFLKQLAFR